MNFDQCRCSLIRNQNIFSLLVTKKNIKKEKKNKFTMTNKRRTNDFGGIYEDDEECYDDDDISTLRLYEPRSSAHLLN
jgi:hypothetical protein